MSEEDGHVCGGILGEGLEGIVTERLETVWELECVFGGGIGGILEGGDALEGVLQGERGVVHWMDYWWEGGRGIGGAIGVMGRVHWRE